MRTCSVVDLGGTWSLRNVRGNVSASASVPGEVHTDLLRAGVLAADPYFRYNDVEFRWVLFEDWVFSRTFSAADVPAGAQVRLVFEGVDTIATVELNGVVVGTTDNMFRRYEFDIGSTVDRQALNTLTVTIKVRRSWARRG